MTFASALTLPRSVPLFDAFARTVAQFRQSQAQRRAYLALRAEFDRMSDADWRDLGVSRHNARELALQTIYGH